MQLKKPCCPTHSQVDPHILCNLQPINVVAKILDTIQEIDADGPVQSALFTLNIYAVGR